MTFRLGFVDSISATPMNRLDFNTSGWTPLATTEFGFPPLRYAVASTSLADGAIIPSATYENRQITLRLNLQAVDADTAATQLQAFHRELNRSRNILQYQIGTQPVFFRTFRAAPDSVNIITDGQLTAVEAVIPAEPFGYGLLEIPVSSATLDPDPAGATNPCYLDVTGVKGDVETPALIRWPASAAAVGLSPLFAVRRRGTPSSAPFLFQAEALTQGTDTTTQANDANFSGAGNNWSRCTFATDATLVTRLSTTDVGTAGVDLRGRYRVILRYRKGTAGDTIILRLRWGTSGGVVTANDSVTIPSLAGSATIADLGELQIPRGWDPTYEGRSGIEVAVSDTFHFAIQASRTGSGNLDFDFVLLVPADDRLAIAQWAEAGLDRWWFDAEDNNAHTRNASDQIGTAAPPGIAGGLPMLSPGQTNRVYMLRNVQAAGAYSIASTISPVSIAYYPRYLYIRPSST